jgi:light-regulated signal transduction histidine kinase (bacteriophytochrome)
MSTLIDALLALAGVVRAPMARRPTDLSRVATMIAAELQSQDASRQVTFEVTDGLTADADPALVTVLLQNLVGNAWKFTSKRDGARIVVGCAASENGRTFYVRDNGIGFEQRRAQRLFEPFQRLHSPAEFDAAATASAELRPRSQRSR